VQKQTKFMSIDAK